MRCLRGLREAGEGKGKRVEQQKRGCCDDGGDSESEQLRLGERVVA